MSTVKLNLSDQFTRVQGSPVEETGDKFTTVPDFSYFAKHRQSLVSEDGVEMFQDAMSRDTSVVRKPNESLTIK